MATVDDRLRLIEDAMIEGILSDAPDDTVADLAERGIRAGEAVNLMDLMARDAIVRIRQQEKYRMLDTLRVTASGPGADTDQGRAAVEAIRSALRDVDLQPPRPTANRAARRAAASRARR